MPRSVVVALMCVALLAVTSFAANIHFKGGKKAGPSCVDNGLTLSTSGKLAGLGNGDLVIIVVATGQPTATCTNPSGANKPPGQNPAEVVLTGTQTIPASAVKNGNTSFGPLVTATVATPIPGAPDCPNARWTEDITDVVFTSFVITVQQPPGVPAASFAFSFVPGTLDGNVPAGDIVAVP